MKNRIFCAVLVLVTLVTVGCKKDDDDTTKPTLSGLELTSNCEAYMGVGCNIEVKADISNLVSDDDTFPDAIGLYWSLNGTKRDTLTLDAKVKNPAYTATIDKAGEYTLICYAFNEDYYSSSASLTFTVLDPSTAITGLNGEASTQIGSQYYHTLTAGNKLWMGNNLYDTATGTNYQDSEILSPLFGKYYSWEEAQTACPSGWHLPSGADFDQCLGSGAGALMANVSFVEKEMWPYWPNVKITNTLDFNAMPVGYRDFTRNSSPEGGFKEYACFWTSDQQDGLGEYRYIFAQNDTVLKGQGSKTSLAMSVRCIQD